MSEFTREEHEEFSKRVDEHFTRVDARMTDAETQIKMLKDQNVTLGKLATNMEAMCTEQKKQGQRLERLEARDGEKWRQAVGYVATAVVSVIAGVIVALLTTGA